MSSTAASNRPSTKAGRTVSLVAALVAAFVMGQSLFFKFSAAPEAVALFETLGAEPVGRIGTGVAELLAVVLLLVPRTRAMGGALTLAIMAGAVFSHLTVLGIEVTGPNGEGDGGALFAMALVTAVAATTVSWLERRGLPVVGARAESADRPV